MQDFDAFLSGAEAFFLKNTEKSGLRGKCLQIGLAYRRQKGYNDDIYGRNGGILSMFNVFALESATPTGGGDMTGLITLGMMAIVFVAFYFFAIRPQRKQEKETNAMRNNLTVGDEVTTIGGIIGKVISIKEETCVIETSRDLTRIRILKSAISRVDVKAEDAD
jgi:preprotein translocase subunit YajC